MIVSVYIGIHVHVDGRPCLGSHGTNRATAGDFKLEGSLPPSIGPYRIRALLGAGGMGEVYRGHDSRLDRAVALKRVHPDSVNAERSRARFRREARLAARLNHPACVQIFDVVEYEGDDWLVMELIRGETLADTVRDRALAPNRVIEIGAEIAEGLAAAHEAGLVHRDLKLSNVMLTTTGEVKILDFGIAKQLTDGGGASVTTVSTTGVVIGTVSAMSPEQATGKEVDHRSDLFSLGSLLYQMLTGVAPFGGGNAYETVSRICLEKEVPAHVRRPAVPIEASRLVGRLLEKEPARRPQSAAEVAKMARRAALALTTAQNAEEASWLDETIPSEALGLRARQVRGSAPAVGTASRVSQRVQRTVRPLLTSTLVDSGRLLQEVDESRAIDILADHQRLVNRLLREHRGRRIEDAAGFQAFFDLPADAIRYAIGYHLGLFELAAVERVGLGARVGIHIGDAAEPKAFERSGLVQHTERLMNLAKRGQTLVSRTVHDLARDSGTFLDARIRWCNHRTYRATDDQETFEVFEVGVEGRAPLARPPDTDQARRWPPAARWRERLPTSVLVGVPMLLALVGMGWRFMTGPLLLTDPLYVAVAPTTFHGDEGLRDESILERGAVKAGILRALVGLRDVVAVDAVAPELPVDDWVALARAVGTDEVISSRLECTRRLCQILIERIAGSDGSVLWSRRFTASSANLLDLSLTVGEQLRPAFSSFESREEEVADAVLPADYDAYLRVLHDLRGRTVGDTWEAVFQSLEALRRSSPRFIEARQIEIDALRIRFLETRDHRLSDKALSLMEEALALAPHDARVLKTAAELFVDVGALERSEAMLDALRRREPGDARALAIDARLHDRRGEPEAAMALLRRAIERQPSWNNHSNMADMAYRMGDFETARQHLEAWLKLVPNAFEATSRLAQFELRDGSAERAAQLYEGLVAQFVNETDLNNLGVAYLLLERYEAAVETFGRALTFAPSSPFALLNLADAHGLRGSAEEAKVLYQRVLEEVARDPDPDALLTVKAQALAHLGRAEEAVAAMHDGLRLSPANPEVAYSAALVYVLVGDETSALVQARRSLGAGVAKRWFDFAWFDSLRPRLQD